MEGVILQKDNDLIDSFTRDCSLRNMSKETVRSYISNLRVFKGFLDEEGLGLLQVNRNVLKDFILYLREVRKNSQKRIQNDFSALNCFYEYMVYEGVVDRNPVLEVRKRYLRRYKGSDPPGERKLISVEQMSDLIDSILDPKDKAMAMVLAKTGVRRGELIRMDLEDVNWEELSITLKPTPKRSNRLVFFDDECARVLRRWLEIRPKIAKPEESALFVSEARNRINRNSVYEAITKWAKRIGLHDPSSPKMEDHFSPHNFRHWFTTHLIRNGMKREYVKELRGDARREAIDLYNHIDREELRKSYSAHVPKLGI